MKHSHNIKRHMLLWAMLGVSSLAPSAWAQSGCFIDNNGNRACPVGPDQGGDSSDRPTYDFDSGAARRAQERQERAELNARYDAIHKRSKIALESGDFQEALRLLREKQALRDGPAVREAIAGLEKHFADQANRELGDRYNQQAGRAYDSGDYKQALKLYRQALSTYPNATTEYRQFIANFERSVERIEKAHTEAIDRERRHRPEVERLRAEAKTIMKLRPTEALAKLDAALKMLPDDTKVTADWWLAKANLSLHEGKYDEAIHALQSAQSFAGDSPEVVRARTQVTDERTRQGANIQYAFDELRQRLAAASSADTVDDAFGTKKTNPSLTPTGARKIGTISRADVQAKSVERHSNQAKSGNNDNDKTVAGMGFDDTGDYSGSLIYPDKNKYQQIPFTTLDQQIPRGAQDDIQIKGMQTWYRSLDAQKTEKKQRIAEIKEKQRLNNDPSLEMKIATLNNDIKRLADDQGKATATVKERVKVVKKEMLNKGLIWDERPLPARTKTSESVTEPAPDSSKLDFILN
ncbi:MAG: tetratricopeptide repeat protein [Pseudomonadota bacterium]